MKRRGRKIIVDGRKYIWNIRFNIDGDGGVYLFVYHSGKSVIEERVCDKAITPGVVAEKIKSIHS